MLLWKAWIILSRTLKVFYNEEDTTEQLKGELILPNTTA